MSFNQSRPDKNQEYRKSERSASSNQQHRGFSPAYRKGTAAGAGGPAPSLNNNRSFKKINNNAQGGQSRASVATVNPSDSGIASAPRGGVQNGAHLQPQLHGVSDAPVVSTAPKQTEPSAPQRSSRTVPKAPTSQNASMTSDTRAPTTPAKSPGDASKGFSFQFGSISPGLVNGMQIPARTSSAPPNLDEQKRDQARNDSFRTVPSQPTPSVPKQQLPRKDHASVDQANAAEAHLVPKTKKDVQVLPPAPPTGQNLKPSGHPMAGISMSMPFHQPQVSVQFGPNQQIQSQGMSANSMQMPMPMPLPMGSTQVQPPVFVPGLQPHPMQSQGIMHQGQNLSFTPQMGPQLPQLGNLGMGLAPQYPQQQGGKYAGPRKTPVKITHPDTHEELRLDKRTDSYSDGGSSAPRTHPNVPQSQPIPSFAPSHPPSYYTNSYTGSSLYFPAPSSHPLTSSHMPPNSQPPRFSYPVSQGPQGVPFMNPPAHNSLPVSKSGSPNLEHARDVHNLIASVPSTTIPVTVKPAGGTVGEKVVDSLPNSAAAVEKGEFPKPSRPSGEVSQTHPQRYSELSSDGFLQQSKPGSDPLVLKSLPVTEKSSVGAPAAVSVESQASNPLASASAAPSEESVPVVTTTDARSKETLSRSNSIKDQQKKPGKKGIIQQQHQVVGQSSSTSSFPSRASGHGISSSSGVPETVEANTTPAPVSSESVSESVKESLSDVNAATADVSESKAETTGEGTISISSEISGPGIAVDTSVFVHDSQVDNSSLLDEQGKHDLGGAEKQAEKSLSQGYKQDTNSCGISSEPISVKTLESVKEDAEHSVVKETTKGNAAATSETAQRGQDQNVSSHAELDGMDASSSITDSMGTNEVAFSKSGRVDQLSAPVQTTELSGAISKHEVISVENTGGGGGNIENIGSGGESLAVPGSKDKPLPELSRTKSTTSKGKKKKREILLKADAAGVNSDLYGAYKNPEEKKGIASPESTESTSTSVVSKQVAADASQQDAVVTEEDATSKAEPEDWEDAADISTPKMETSDNGEEVRGGMIHSDKDGNEHGANKYSRDFLMMYSGKFTDLPEGFEISSDIEEILNANVNTSPSVDYDSQPSPGRIIDRPGGAARLERRGSGIIDDDRWSKGGNANFRPGQGVNYGVLRNPRAPVQHVRGILPGPTQPQGGMQRNSPDADRWQRATNFQPKGLMPSPQTPLQIMHKAERKYEVGKVSDEEQAKQRQLKAILNKLTPQNFEKLFEQVKAVNIDNATTLTGVISQIFDKALMEPTFCEMYANFCFYLSGELPDFSEDNEKVTFKRLLLNSCQMEFERGEREQEEANKADEEGEVKQSEEEREEKRIKARRRMLGNIRLIGELYKKKMLTERIMHECIKKLLGQQQTPDEEDIEALCKLMSTIGEMIDHPKAKEHMDAYFDRMKSLSNNMKLSSRVRFMLKDAIDLRRNKWQQRRKVEGPKKIEEVHRDAAQERQAQTSRLGRGPGINPSARRGAPMDFSPRGSPMLSSPNPQTGGFRGMPTQVRGYGSQDARIDERHSYESRTLSVPLTQRPLGDDSITLGPQGGLARGMSIRGSLSMSPAPLTEIPSAGDSRRMAAGLNGFSSLSERATTYLPREDLVPRHMPDRFAGPAAYDQSSAPERNINFGGRDPRNSDRSFDRSLPTSPPKRVQGAALTQNAPSEKVPTEERLRDMFLLAIKEFYSARDEKEVALCIKDLNSPSFHPLMISLWVTDSFERKDTERDLLAKLLVNLTTSHDGALSQSQLIKGFETVLSTLEDAVNDAPRAPEFLGLIFAKVILENVVSLKQIGQLIYEGGEEPGHLLKVGLAGNVLGNILEIIKSEKGESVLNEIRTASNLRLETFRPPDPHKSRILEKFI